MRFSDLPEGARPDCKSCPFADPVTQGPRHAPVTGTCLKKPVGLLVGESPGGEEVEKQEVFVGRTGKWLDVQLRHAGLDRGDLSLVNTIGCQPPKGLKTDSNMGRAAHACYPMFAHQTKNYGKLPTFAMGKWAGWAVAGQKAVSVETGRGFIRDRVGGGQWVLSWHPTYAAFYNPWKGGEFIIDIDRFRRLIEGKLERVPATIIHPTVADVRRIARGATYLAVDIETRPPPGEPAFLGKDPTRADLKTIAIGNCELGVAYWWGSDPAVQRAIVEVMHDKRVTKGFHNGHYFDLRVLSRYGVRPNPVEDTRDDRRAVSATSRLSLRFLVSVYSDFAPWKELEDEK